MFKFQQIKLLVLSARPCSGVVVWLCGCVVVVVWLCGCVVVDATPPLCMVLSAPCSRCGCARLLHAGPLHEGPSVRNMCSTPARLFDANRPCNRANLPECSMQTRPSSHERLSAPCNKRARPLRATRVYSTQARACACCKCVVIRNLS